MSDLEVGDSGHWTSKLEEFDSVKVNREISQLKQKLQDEIQLNLDKEHNLGIVIESLKQQLQVAAEIITALSAYIKNEPHDDMIWDYRVAQEFLEQIKTIK
jgi:transcriptional regulator with AAA-type ATPase domain